MPPVSDPATASVAIEFHTVPGRGPWYGQMLGLRVECLRSDRAGTGELPRDEVPTTRHVLAVAGGGLIGAGTLVAEPSPFDDAIKRRLRALAVHPLWRRRRVGRDLILRRLQLCAPFGSWSLVRVGASERLHLAVGGRRVGEPHVSATSWTSDPMGLVRHRGWHES